MLTPCFFTGYGSVAHSCCAGNTVTVVRPRLPVRPKTTALSSMSESSSLKLPKLSREGDYRSWSQMMRAYLITQDRLDKFLDATPATGDAKAEEQDLICRAKLQLQVTGPLSSIVSRADSAKAAWDALRDDYKGSLKTRQPQLTAQLT